MSMGVVASLCMCMFCGTKVFAAQSTNKAWCEEHIQLYYDGYIQFTPSFKIPSSPGYSLKTGKHVKRAYVNFTRDGESVTTNGGRLYTGEASSVKQTTKFSAKARAYDSLIPWAPKTRFYYGWIYF